MDVFVPGKYKVTLNQADFKAQGGQGSVYIKADTAYKIYADPQKMISPAKMRELEALTLPNIIRPLDLLTDKTGAPVGYTMRSVADTFSLCQLFTKAFRDRNHITGDTIVRLVRKLQDGVAHVHSQGILIVDLNELNFLVDNNFDTIYFIDVDSYQTPGFAASALMESIRDRHSTQFSTGTDWFSFAIVSFLMFAGVHPYKGTHPTVKTMEERMQANISVFCPDVHMPGTCQPLSAIPESYREWYRAVFEHGKRLPPPDAETYVANHILPQITGCIESRQFRIEELQDFPGSVLNFVNGLIVTTDGVFLGGSYHLNSRVIIGILPVSGHAVGCWIENGLLRLYDLHARRDIHSNIQGEEVMAVDGRIYVKHEGLLLETNFIEMPAGMAVGTKVVANVMEQATQVFEGCILQNMLGAHYVSVFPQSGKSYQFHIKELDGFRIIDARYESSVLMIVAERHGRYDRFVLRFNTNFTSYDVRAIENVSLAQINFTVLDHGICLSVNESEELEVFASRPGSTSVKVIADPAINGACKLFKNGTQAMFARDCTLYKFTMKQ